MTRQHASGYQPPEDQYAHARCMNCPHFVNAGQKPGRKCQYAPRCKCTDHRLASAPEGGDAA